MPRRRAGRHRGKARGLHPLKSAAAAPTAAAVAARAAELKGKAQDDADAYYGFVPSKRGFAVRTQPGAAAAMLKVFNPPKVRAMGPALEVRAESYWRIRNLPEGVDERALNHTLPKRTPHWAGWAAVAIRRMPQEWGEKGSCSWIVGAQQPPPADAFKAGRRVCRITPHDQLPRAGPGSTSSALLPRPDKVNLGGTARQSWADASEEDEGEDMDEEFWCIGSRGDERPPPQADGEAAPPTPAPVAPQTPPQTAEAGAATSADSESSVQPPPLKRPALGTAPKAWPRPPSKETEARVASLSNDFTTFVAQMESLHAETTARIAAIDSVNTELQRLTAVNGHLVQNLSTTVGQIQATQANQQALLMAIAARVGVDTNAADFQPPPQPPRVPGGDEEF